MVQHPEEKLGTSLVLRGKQGSGKTIIGTVIGKLLGQHYVQVADPRYITGQFNSHLARCLFLHCDEGFWAGDKGAEGKLKDLVTGDYQLVEYKGKEPIRLRNLVRLLITSNNSWVVPAGFEERRFCVLDVGDSHMQDHAYFEAIFSQLEDGGYEALLHALITFDLTQINLRQVPSTAALTEQKYETMTPVQSWWFERLRDGVVREQDDVWEITVSTKEVVDSYMTHARQMGISRRAAETSLGMQLQQVVPRLSRNKVLCSAWVKVDENWVKEPKRQYAYNLPPLEDCRSFFDDKMGVETDWECGLV
jgi:hypothetical protein